MPQARLGRSSGTSPTTRTGYQTQVLGELVQAVTAAQHAAPEALGVAVAVAIREQDRLGHS